MTGPTEALARALFKYVRVPKKDGGYTEIAALIHNEVARLGYELRPIEQAAEAADREAAGATDGATTSAAVAPLDVERRLVAALTRLQDAIVATDWDRGAAGGEIAGALIQADFALSLAAEENDAASE